MTSPTEVTTLALLLGRLERLNEQLVAEICGRNGTTPAELRVLALLRLGTESGSATPTNIASLIVQTSGGLTATLHRLERAGSIIRTPDPLDGRGRLVELTAAGCEFADHVLDALVAEYTSMLSDVDVESALESVRGLIDVMARRTDERTTDGWTVPAQHAGSSA